MKIAVYINEKGQVGHFQEKGFIRLYESSDGKWRSKKDIPFSLANITRLTGIKQALVELVKELEDCTIFLSGDIHGIAYVFLRDELGFSIWKSEGNLEEQIKIVTQKEQNLRALAMLKADCRKGCCDNGKNKERLRAGSGLLDVASFLNKMNDEGDYSISLVEVMRKNPSLNSREILMPVMEKIPFRKLEIFCDHLPRWFSQKTRDLCLKSEIETSKRLEQSVKITLSHASA